MSNSDSNLKIPVIAIGGVATIAASVLGAVILLYERVAVLETEHEAAERTQLSQQAQIATLQQQVGQHGGSIALVQQALSTIRDDVRFIRQSLSPSFRQPAYGPYRTLPESP